MAESDERLYKQAFQLFGGGDSLGARAVMLQLYKTSRNPDYKLKSIMGLVAPVNHKNIDETISYCDEGIIVARSLGKEGECAYLKANKGYALVVKTGPHSYRMSMLKLPPGWFNFSLDEEKQEYEKLQSEVEGLFKGSRRLIKQAVEISARLTDKSYLAHVLMFKGEALAQEVLTLQMLTMKEMRHKKLFKYFHFSPLLFHKTTEQEKIKQCLGGSKQAFVESAKIFEQMGDYSNAGYSFYNLANRLRSPESAKYLRRATYYAVKEDDRVLIRMCKGLRQEIRGFWLFQFIPLNCH